MFFEKYSRKMKFFSNMRVLKNRVLKQVSKKDADKTCAERINPFLLLFKFCGLFANSVTGGRVKRCSWPNYGICIFWLSIAVSYLCYIIFYFMTMEHIDLSTMVLCMKIILRYISIIADIITAYFSQNHFNKLFDRLDGYDFKASRLKRKRKDNLWIPQIVTLLFMCYSLLFFVCVLFQVHKLGDELFGVQSYIYSAMLCCLSSLQKFLLLYLVLERFKHLNKNIAPNVSWNEERREPNAIKITDVKIMHSMLYDAHEAFNDIYRNPVLLTLITLVFNVVVNMKNFRKDSILAGSSQVGAAMLLVLLMCTICHKTAEEANNTVCVLNKSMTMLVNSGKTLSKINTLTYFLHNRVSFDAAMVFTIDLPLFQSIVATLTTYFILLI